MAPTKGENKIHGKKKVWNAEMRSQMKRSIEEQVKFEKKAFEWQEYLISARQTTPSKLANIANHILPNHYADVTIERAIGGVCGFPLCDKPADCNVS